MKYFRFRGYASDYFVCTKCGKGMYVKVLGNTYSCPDCGGIMNRQ